ncbi:MAG TPA: undecaprenyl-phosphate galactose phosphotransferase WbaP, partial [Anaerolineales bacterium]
IFVVLGITLALLFYGRGLYPGVGMHYVDEMRHIVSTVMLAFLVMLGVTFALHTTLVYSRIVLAAAGVLCLAFIPFGRYVVRGLLIRVGLWGEPVAIVGDPEKCRELVGHFIINLQFGLRPMAMLDPGPEPCALLSTEQMKFLAEKMSLQTVLVLVEDLNQVDELVETYRAVFPRVILLRDQTGGYGLSQLRPMDFNEVLGLQVRNNLLDSSAQFYKRLSDVLVSFLGALVISPLLLGIAALIALDSRGGVWYRQTRLGRDGKPFKLLKFRTMYRGADKVLKEALARDPSLRAEWDAYQKLKDDPRITRVGRWLRRFSLDELPQLWNVARGEMSLVGPRPITPDQRAPYGPAFKQYIRVTPGMTGLWQVTGRNETTFARRAALDVEYIQRWSLWLDVYILLKTAKIVLGRDGAY